MFKKNLLSRKYISDKYYVHIDDSIYSNKKDFINFLKQIEEEFYSHDFKKDSRYVCTGRHKLLIQEMQQLYYTKEQCQKLHLDICPTKWCLHSLIEMMSNQNSLTLNEYQELININDVYFNKSVSECRQIYDAYNNENIISLNERDYILHALNMIKDSLDKCNDNLEW